MSGDLPEHPFCTNPSSAGDACGACPGCVEAGRQLSIELERQRARAACEHGHVVGFRAGDRAALRCVDCGESFWANNVDREGEVDR